MVQHLFNQLRGQVHLQVESPFPERILNLCSTHGLAFWGVTWESPSSFTCSMARKDFYRLRSLCDSLDCTITLQSKEGVPFFLGRFRHRQMFLWSVFIGLCVLFFSSFFIWDFTVYGNDTVPEEQILRALSNQDIKLGTFGFAVDSENLRNHVLLEIPELSWISVNVSGCRAYVQVNERNAPPPLVEHQAPSNVVATRDGLVLKTDALGGNSMVLPGTMVVKDQLLITGIVDVEPFGAQLLTGMGSVMARTWHTYHTVLPLEVMQKVYTGDTISKNSIILGTNRIKFFLNSSISGVKYDKITTETQWSLFGIPLPITSVKETLRPYTLNPVTLQAQDVETIGNSILEPYLKTQLGEEDRVSSSLCQIQQGVDGWNVSIRAECVEEIGTSVPIYTEDTPPPLEEPLN